MFAKRVSLSQSVFLAALICQLCLPFAAAQNAPVASLGPQAPGQVLWTGQAKARALLHAPITPAEVAMKAQRAKKHAKVHPYGGGSPLSNETFITSLDFSAAGQGTQAVAAKDVNNDGNIDLVLANNCQSSNNCVNGTVDVLLGNGDGTFQTPVSYSSGGASATAVALVDVNGDGKPDILVTNNCTSNSNCSNGSVSVLLGNGDGTFQTAVSYSTGGVATRSLAVVDVNGDGKPDVLVANQCNNGNNCTGGSASVLLGNGDGTFQAAVPYSSGAITTLGIAVADVNGDGKPDMVLADQCASNSNCSNGLVSVLLGNGDGTFQAAVTYTASGTYANSVAIADVNGDGKPDLLVTSECESNSNCNTGVVNVFLGNGDGTFQTAVAYNSGGQSANSVAVSDINGDGYPDLLVSNITDGNGNWQDGSTVAVLLGNGNGTFQTPVSYAAGDYEGTNVIVADVNGDGKPDVVMASACTDDYDCYNGGVSVFLGNGNGTLHAGVNYSTSSWDSFTVAAADFNGDGKLDLVLASACSAYNSCSNGAASVLLGNGDGTFQTATTYGSGGDSTIAVAVGDVNGDGKPDLVLANQCASNSNCSNGSVSVLLGNGDGTFQTAVAYGSGGEDPISVAIADVNGDGNPDLLVANQCASNSNCSNGSVSVLLGNGDGTFQAAVPYSTAAEDSFSIAAADVNGDGKIDLVLSSECANNNCANGAVSVLLGNGDGTFQTAVVYNSGGVYALAVAVGDLNGDGKPDVVVSNQCNENSNCTTGIMAVLLGNGDGTFQSATTTPIQPDGYIQTLVLADFNGDHKLDVASGAANVLLFGNGDGTFQTPIALGASGSGLAVGDFNGDGRPDLAVGGVSVLLNISSGFVFPTTTTVTSSLNPSSFGASVTFTATVAAQVTGTPTGTVTFSDGSTTLGQGTVSGGTASYSTSALATGPHSITAAYSGDTNFTASTSSALSQNVQMTSTTTSLTASTTAANVGQSVTFTATVTPGTSGVPTGSVSFLDGSTVLATTNLNGGGVATYSTSALAAGTHNITALYGGDGNFNGSASAPPISVVVTAAGFSLSSSALTPASVSPGTSAQSTITITPAGGLSPSSVTLSCSVSPVVTPAVNCSLGSISVSNGNGSATLTLGTTAPSTSVRPFSAHVGQLAVLALALPGLVLCGAGISKPNRRKLLAIGIVFLALTGCMLQTACGGSSSAAQTTTPGTPAGSYTVTVTGNASGMQQTTTVSLTVQ